MKTFLLFTSIFIFPILFFAQSKTVEIRKTHNFDYIKFLKNTHNAFTKGIENKLGYRKSLEHCVWLLGDEKYSQFSTKKLEQKLEKYLETRMTSVASCHYEIVLDTLGFLTILRRWAPEGRLKASNSTVGDLESTYPSIYNIQEQKEILLLSDFLTSEGEKFVKKSVREIIHYRFLHFKDDKILNWGYKYMDIRKAKIDISLDEKKIHWNDHINQDGEDTLFFHFYLSEDGLFIGENDMYQDYEKAELSFDPSFTLLYEDILPYIKMQTLKDFANSFILSANKSYQVKRECHFWDSPSGHYMNAYLIKGDKCTSIKETKKWIYCEYKNKKGIVTKGWLPKTDLTLIIQ